MEKNKSKSPRIAASLIKRFRREMLDPGWCIVDTSRFFASWSRDKPALQSVNNTFFPLGDEWKQVLAATGYKQFISKLVRRALSDEAIFSAGEPSEIELRLDGYNPNGLPDEDGIEQWHFDGGYIRAICCIEGSSDETTEVLKRNEILRAPLQHTLFMTAQERVRGTGISATLHRKPLVRNKIRNLVVCTWWSVSFTPSRQLCLEHGNEI